MGRPQTDKQETNMNEDLLPKSQKARAILAAIGTLEATGIEATIRFERGASPPAWIDFTPSKANAAQMSDLLPTEANAIIDARQMMINAGMDIALQVDRAPFCIGVQPPAFPEQIHLAAKEEIRLAVVAALEYQFIVGAADIAIAQARSHNPDAL
jgi:hypothetical protein